MTNTTASTKFASFIVFLFAIAASVMLLSSLHHHTNTVQPDITVAPCSATHHIAYTFTGICVDSTGNIVNSR